MRIWHVTDSYAPIIGGIEVHVAALAAHQSAHGDRVRVLTLTPDTSDAEATDVEVVRMRTVDGLRAALRTERPDVLHVHASVWSPLAATAIRAAHAARVPALVTVHSMWSEIGPLPWLARHGLGLPTADVLWTAVSRPAAAALAPVVDPRPVHVLANAVDPTTWTGLADPFRDPAAPVHLVSVMRLTRVKRAVPLARVLREVRDRLPADVAVRATIAGDGPQRDRLAAYLRRHRMTDWVDLPGVVDRHRVRDLLADADAFVAPATRESFGIAALEARAAGVPVVAPRVSGVTEFVTDGVDGLLADDDSAMAAALADLCRDPGLRVRLRHHSATTPVAHDWDRARVAAAELYAEAARLVGTPTLERV